SLPKACGTLEILAAPGKMITDDIGAQMQARILVLQGAAWGEHRHAPFFVYAVPPELQPQIQSGQLVLVPFGARLVSGLVWDVAPSPGPSRRGTGTLLPIRDGEG